VLLTKYTPLERFGVPRGLRRCRGLGQRAEMSFGEGTLGVQFVVIVGTGPVDREGVVK
jgi:hypothetical protein